MGHRSTGILAAVRTRGKSTGGRLPKMETHDISHATTTALGHHNDYPEPRHIRRTLDGISALNRLEITQSPGIAALLLATAML